MQPSNVTMMPGGAAAPPEGTPQRPRNRRRSARVPSTAAVKLDITMAWWEWSSENALAESVGTVRPNIEHVVRQTLHEHFPELGDRLKRIRNANRRSTDRMAA